MFILREHEELQNRSGAKYEIKNNNYNINVP